MSNKYITDTSVPSFRFLVEIENQSIAAFTECTLPIIEWEIETIKEGGLNTYTHQIPGRRKGGKISLKNGVGKSSLLDWYINCMAEEFKRKPISVILLNPQKKKVMQWNLAECLPIKWIGPQLKSGDNSIAIQTLEFVCNDITVIPS